MKHIIEARETYPLGKGLKNLTLAERLYLNIPVYAIILMVSGLILCFDYTALGRFFGSMNITKWLLTIVGCSLTILGVVLRLVGNRIRGYDEYGRLFSFSAPGTPNEERDKKHRLGNRFCRMAWWLMILGPVVQLIAAVMK